MTHDAFQIAVLTSTGGAPDSIEPGKLHRFATNGKRGDTAGWALMFDDCRGGVFGCHRQSIRASWTAAAPSSMTPRERVEHARKVEKAMRERDAALRVERAENARNIAATWAQCVSLTSGDPVALYLARRGLGGVWPLPSCLRLHRALPYWHDGAKVDAFPAMVAPLVAPDGRMVALHRTYLTAVGTKADVPTVKKLTATAGPLSGARIPLHAPRGDCIGVAEGIETALAAWLVSGVPTIATYSAGNLAAYRWPAGVRRLAVFADADRAGRAAGDALRARALSAGLRCEVLTPSDDGADWCDVHRGVVEGAAA